MTSVRAGEAPAAAVRSWRDAAAAGAALAVLVLVTLIASDRQVPGWERSLFAAVNECPVLPFAAVWPVMQLGNVGVVLLAGLVAALTRRVRLAAGLIVAGLLAYWLAKIVKGAVERPRPTGLIEDVVVRGPHVLDHGFVSGHAAVAAVVAAVLLPYVGRRAGVVLVALALLVGLARVYVGAHLPLDVVGGAALAVVVACLVHLALGRPVRRAAGSRDTGAG
jgi:membrane-associated phospholipid phosphatase